MSAPGVSPQERLEQCLSRVVGPQCAQPLVAELLAHPPGNSGEIQSSVTRFFREQRIRPPMLNRGDLAEIKSGLDSCVGRETEGRFRKSHLAYPLPYISGKSLEIEDVGLFVAHAAEQILKRHEQLPVKSVRIWLDVSRVGVLPLPIHYIELARDAYARLPLAAALSPLCSPTSGKLSAPNGRLEAKPNIDLLFDDAFQRGSQGGPNIAVAPVVPPDFLKELYTRLTEKLPHKISINFTAHAMPVEHVASVREAQRLLTELTEDWLQGDPQKALATLKKLIIVQTSVENLTAEQLKEQILRAKRSNPAEMPLVLAATPLTGTVRVAFGRSQLSLSENLGSEAVVFSSFIHLSGSWLEKKDGEDHSDIEANDLLRELLWHPVRNLVAERELLPLRHRVFEDQTEGGESYLWTRRPAEDFANAGLIIRTTINYTDAQTLQQVVESCSRRLNKSPARQAVPERPPIEMIGLMIIDELNKRVEQKGENNLAKAFSHLLQPYLSTGDQG